MKEILIKLNSIRQSLTASAHIVNSNVRKYSTRMPESTKTDLENVLKYINRAIEELYGVIKELNNLQKK